MLAPRPGPVPKVNSRPGLNLTENDGGARLGRGLTGVPRAPFGSCEGKKKTRPCDRVQNKPIPARELDAPGTNRVCGLAKVHHFPIMPLEFESRKEENSWKLVRSALTNLF